MSSRHSKIVCTLGPATNSPRMIRRLLEAGMDVARLNFSHGTHEDHARRLAMVREASEALGKPVAVLQDLCGPKIRSGRGAPPALEEGSEVFLVEGKTGDARTIAIEYPGLADDLHVGDLVRLDDGHGKDDPLNLIIEVSGQARDEKDAKVSTAQTLWVPAVNNAGTWGRWAFVEIDDPWDAKRIIGQWLVKGRE